MAMTPASQTALPTNRAFVVQFRVTAMGAPPAWEGRVEPVVSGQAAGFHAVEELLAFMNRVLVEVQGESDAP
jgi:hypothetical protein